jgi:uncharacterized membrane protein YfcA
VSLAGVGVGPLRDLLTALIGLGAGLLSGLFGVGGGVLSQPGMRFLGIPPLTVIGSALPVVLPGALTGTRRYVREGLVHWPAVVATVPAGIVASVVGGVLGERVPGDGHLLQVATALLLGLSAWRMARVRSPLPPDEPLAETDAPEAPGGTAGTTATAGPVAAAPGRYAGIGALAGGLSGLLGIGGGVVMVPAFVQAARMDVKRAIATSLACVGAFAVPGTITHVALGHVDWRVVAALVVGAVPGARLGAHLTIRAEEGRFRQAVAWFLAATAVLYVAEELNALL